MMLFPKVGVAIYVHVIAHVSLLRVSISVQIEQKYI